MASRKSIRVSRKGFTLIELVIVITVIAILAALLVPTILGQTERARIAQAKDSVNELAKSFKRFHEDTSYWPLGGSIWTALPGAPGHDVQPTAFTTNDTTLFLSAPPPTINGLSALKRCDQTVPGMICYNGPYLSRGTSLGDTVNQDPWGLPYMFMLIRPSDGMGGGDPSAPNGAVAVWSAGPDGLDQTGCTATAKGSGGCAVNYKNIVAGKPSLDGADDLMAFAGTAN